ncbi:unnamed protein product [Paramecium sonneborni]|uniref:Uncharacterized protein n=1 Tax=Paramecium sonneborni TaxID=65129 RepID=A0A8S1LH06_9CILI|nr:unnamed protein product [Paramecium sonneborni]
MNNFEENLSQCKNLKDIRDKIINYNKTNNDQMKFNLINPSRLEYFYKVNQIFKKKQLKNNYVEFIEQLIWQNYYYYSLKFEQKDYELYSIQKKIDKKIQIYQTAQKQLQNYLIQELRFLNQFHQSLYRDNYEEIIFGENIQKEYEEKMKINFQYEYYQILKTYFQDSKNLEGYIKKQIQNKLQYLWQQHQKMIFDQYLKQATTLIISNITELTGNYPVEQQF